MEGGGAGARCKQFIFGLVYLLPTDVLATLPALLGIHEDIQIPHHMKMSILFLLYYSQKEILHWKTSLPPTMSSRESSQLRRSTSRYKPTSMGRNCQKQFSEAWLPWAVKYNIIPSLYLTHDSPTLFSILTPFPPLAPLMVFTCYNTHWGLTDYRCSRLLKRSSTL